MDSEIRKNLLYVTEDREGTVYLSYDPILPLESYFNYLNSFGKISSITSARNLEALVQHEVSIKYVSQEDGALMLNNLRQNNKHITFNRTSEKVDLAITRLDTKLYKNTLITGIQKRQPPKPLLTPRGKPYITEEQEGTRIFCKLPSSISENQFFVDFEKFGDLDDLYVTNSETNKNRFGYIRYIHPESAEEAIKKTSETYDCRYSDPQKLSKQDMEKPLKRYHRECQHNVSAKTFQRHKEICERQRRHREDQEEDPGNFYPHDHPRVKSVVVPVVKKNDTIKFVSPSKPAPVFTIHPTTIVIARELMEQHPPIIHEETGREIDPFEGALWEDAQHVAIPAKYFKSKEKSIRTDEEVNDLLSYLTLMRQNDVIPTPQEDLMK